VQEIWRNIARFFGAPDHNMISTSTNFIDMLDHCLGTKAADIASILILYETTFLIWKVRNNHEFQGKERNLSSQQIAYSARLHAISLLNYTKSKKKVKRLSNAINFIDYHIERNVVSF
jgi:hypothetical protein